MIDLMLDIETLGRGPGCIVPQVAIVPFNLNGTPLEEGAPTLHVKLHIGDQLAAGYAMDPETVAWWLKQKAAVREDVFSGSVILKDFQQTFNKYIKTIEEKYTTYRIWATAPKLDFGCLHGILVKPGQEYPILYSAERDLRTLRELVKTLYPDFKLPKVPVSHDALDDCNRQIEVAQLCYAELRKTRDVRDVQIPTSVETLMKPIPPPSLMVREGRLEPIEVAAVTK
jgi:hypothetical protein